MHKITNSVRKVTFFAHGGISKKFFVTYINIINETLYQNFHPFIMVTDVWIAPILCVKPPLSFARKCIKKVKFSSLWVKIFKPPVLRVTITVSYNIVAYSFKQLYFCAHDNTYEFCLCIENNLNFAKRFWFTSESEEPIWFMLSRFRLC